PRAPREAPGQHVTDAEPGLGHGLGLEPALRAHEHDLERRADALDLLRDRDAGIHVAAGAAPGDQHLHAASRDQRCLASASPEPCTTLIGYSSPPAARFASRAEPPYDTNGSGSPVVGASPVATARLTSAYSPICNVSPPASRNVNGSSARAAVRMPRHTS